MGLALVEALLACGADVNDANDRGWTPLHQAAYSDQCEIAELLILGGGGPGCRSARRGWDPARGGVVLGSSRSRRFAEPSFGRAPELTRCCRSG